MKLTSAQANKLLRQLQEEKDLLLAEEAQANTFIAATTEKLEDARPAYDYEAVQERLKDLERRIRSVKHAINGFNVSHTVEGFDMTIDQLLIYIPQLSARKVKLEQMARHAPKTRLMSSARSNIIEYEFANYDTEAVKAAYKEVTEELAKAQLALDRLNSTELMELDL